MDDAQQLEWLSGGWLPGPWLSSTPEQSASAGETVATMSVLSVGLLTSNRLLLRSEVGDRACARASVFCASCQASRRGRGRRRSILSIDCYAEPSLRPRCERIAGPCGWVSFPPSRPLAERIGLGRSSQRVAACPWIRIEQSIAAHCDEPELSRVTGVSFDAPFETFVSNSSRRLI